MNKRNFMDVEVGGEKKGAFLLCICMFSCKKP